MLKTILFVAALFPIIGSIMTSTAFVQAQTATSPLPQLPPEIDPVGALCFSHAEFVVCLGAPAPGAGKSSSPKTLTAFFSFTSFQEKNFRLGPELDGISMSGRSFATLAGNYLVLCPGCGTSVSSTYPQGGHVDDRLFVFDAAYVYQCKFLPHATCDETRMQFLDLAKLPNPVSHASLTFVPFTGHYAIQEGAILVAGGMNYSSSAPKEKGTVSRKAVALYVTLENRHVIAKVSGTDKKKQLWTSTDLPSYIDNMTDAPAASFPMLERVILFYNATKASGTPSEGATYVSYIVARFDSTTMKINFRGHFPGYLAPSASSNLLTNIAIDGHMALFAVSKTGALWIADSSEDSVDPKQYPTNIDVKGGADAVSLTTIPPGTDVGLNPGLVISYMTDGKSQAPVSLYPSSSPAVMKNYYRNGNKIRVELAVSCYYSETRQIRVAVGSDCSTPLTKEVASIGCSISSPTDFSFEVDEGHRNVIMCVSRGRCPFTTVGEPNPVTQASPACPQLVKTIAGCVAQHCCVNFWGSSANQHSCLASFSKDDKIPVEFVQASPLMLDFGRTVTRTNTVPFSLPPPTTSSTLTNTTTTTSTTTSVTTQTTTSATATSSTNASHHHNNHHSDSPTSSPNGNNNGENGASKKELKIIVICASSIVGILLVIFGYLIYKRRDDEEKYKDLSARSGRSGSDGKLQGSGEYRGRSSSSLNAPGGRRGGGSNENTPRIRPKPGSNDPMSIIPQFAVVAKIGRGGFGDVYSVRRKTDNEVYALKVYRLQVIHDSSDEDAVGGAGGVGGGVPSGGDLDSKSSSPIRGGAAVRRGSGISLGAPIMKSEGDLLSPSSASSPNNNNNNGNLNQSDPRLLARTQSDLASEAFKSNEGHLRASPTIVRVATLQKVGALAFKEQRIMRKLHRETSGRVVKPIEVYVHGSMEGQQAQAEGIPALSLDANNSNSKYMGGNSSSAGGYGSTQGTFARTSTPNANAAATAASGGGSGGGNNNEETKPLLGAASGGGTTANNNQSFTANTAELHTAIQHGDTRDSSLEGAGRNAAYAPPPDPAQPISYAGSIVAGLFELIPDGNFAAYLKCFRDKQKPLPINTVLRVLAQTADVLHIMSVRNGGIIVHGDVKAENILLRLKAGAIALGDFGTAVEFRKTPSSRSAAAAATAASTMSANSLESGYGGGYAGAGSISPNQRGTLSHNGPLMGKALSLVYAPPERIQGVIPADPSLDWWSFGVLIYLSFCPKGAHARSLAVDIARAYKQSSHLEGPNASGGAGGRGGGDSEAVNDLRDELVAEVSEAGLPEHLAREVMLPSLSLFPEHRLKMDVCRDLLQKEILTRFPDASGKMNGNPTPGLFDSPFSFDLSPE